MYFLNDVLANISFLGFCTFSVFMLFYASSFPPSIRFSYLIYVPAFPFAYFSLRFFAASLNKDPLFCDGLLNFY